MTRSILESVILVVAAMPPPIHGQSAVTTLIVEELNRASSEVVLVDTSPRRMNRGIQYHLRRAWKNGVAVCCAFSLSFRRSKKLYSIVESSFGIIYNYMVVGICRLLGFEIFLHHHTARYCKEKSIAVSFLVALAGAGATHIVLSEAMAKDFSRLYLNGERVLLAHNAYIIPKVENVAAGNVNAVLTVGLLSNLCSEKGLDIAIETCAEAASVGRPVRLILAGPVADRAAEEILRKAQLGSYLVEYRGPVVGDEKLRFFHDIDVFLFPTRYPHEAQPLVLLEAMAAGLPVITNDCGYIAELLDGCGVTVERPEDYVNVAVAILEKWSLDRSMLRAAGNQCEQRFHDLKFAAKQQFVAAIDEIAS